MATEHENAGEDALLRSILDGTAAETGPGFFRSLVRNLSQALGTHGAWVTEYIPGARRLRALAFWLGGDYVEDYEYAIRGTPCEKLFTEKKFLHIPDNVVELFPDDPELPRLGAVSYLGFPLLDAGQNILGNIAVVDIRPMPDSFRSLALFRIFATRATAELLRLNAETELRDREEKLRGIFEGAMDAIIELDRQFNISMMNPAAKRLLALADAEHARDSFRSFLPGRDFDRLKRLVRQLEDRSAGERNLWMPEGLAVLNANGERIRTEATLSQLEIKGEPFYVLILRDVNERYEAAQTIASLKVETYYLRDEIRALYDHGEIVGRSKRFRQTLELVAEVAPTDSTVLIYGESGTGKELIAHTIHAASRRKDRPMITVNCAAIPETLMESELFGHEQGAFTGATRRREGRFSLAHGSTLFLDEVGELSMEMQSKLLRVLQEGEFAPVGSSRNRQVDVRVIAATNRDLSQAVRQEKFRTDLYYRLSVFPITIPPLRDHPDDIGPLADHFVQKYASRMGRRIEPLSTAQLDRLRRYAWPGNVRELQNVVERGVITARHGQLNLGYALPHAGQEASSAAMPAAEAPANTVLTVEQLHQFERQNLLRALERCRWRVSGKQGAAQLVGLPPSTLQSRMKAFGIKRPH